MIEYAMTPPLSILSPDWRATIRCAKCNRKLIPNEAYSVRDMGNGTWECVTCPTRSRVARTERELLDLLARSIKQTLPISGTDRPSELDSGEREEDTIEATDTQP